MQHYSKLAAGKMTSVVKGVFSLMPTSLPSLLYRRVLSKPLIRPFTNAAARMMIPDKFTLPEGVLFLNKKDTAISGALITEIYEPYELQLFREALHPGMTVIDIGANIGIYTVIAAAKVGSGGRVISYEPEQENFSFLKKNIAENRFSHVTAVDTALSDHSGTQQLFLAGDNKGSHSFVKNETGSGSVTVNVKTLDESLREHNCAHVDIIKMDTEGAEPVILEGMLKTLENNHCLTIFTEIYPARIRAMGKDPMKYLTSFSSLGFSLFVIDENKKKITPLPQNEFAAFLHTFPNGESPKNLLCVRK